MATPSTKILVLADGTSACVKIVGRPNFIFGPDLKTLLTGLAQKGYSCFVIDLSECVLMDSTLLGILAGFGLKMNQGRPPDQRGVELLNPNSRISDLLDNLGVLHLFKVTAGSSPLPDSAPAQTTDSVNPTREQVSQTCLEAHRSLMAVNPDNVGRFKDVTQFLAEDLKKPEKSP
jgi:anti-anti-sigma regulatory factor